MSLNLLQKARMAAGFTPDGKLTSVSYTEDGTGRLIREIADLVRREVVRELQEGKDFMRYMENFTGQLISGDLDSRVRTYKHLGAWFQVRINGCLREEEKRDA